MTYNTYIWQYSVAKVDYRRAAATENNQICPPIIPDVILRAERIKKPRNSPKMTLLCFKQLGRCYQRCKWGKSGNRQIDPLSEKGFKLEFKDSVSNLQIRIHGFIKGLYVVNCFWEWIAWSISTDLKVNEKMSLKTIASCCLWLFGTSNTSLIQTALLRFQESRKFITMILLSLRLVMDFCSSLLFCSVLSTYNWTIILEANNSNGGFRLKNKKQKNIHIY